MKNKLYIKDLKKFFNKKRILITGHTGFKGIWLSAILKDFGANIYGFSLKEPSKVKNLKLFNLDKQIDTCYGNITNKDLFFNYAKSVNPHILFHLAAQPLVKESYSNPYDTFETNVIGMLNVLEYAKSSKYLKSVV